MRCRFVLLCGVLLLSFAFLGGKACGETFCGGLSTANSALNGVGSWVDAGPSLISWEIEEMVGYYHYEYTLTVPDGGNAISHFILEVSSSFEEDNIGNIVGSYGTMYIDDYDQGNGNPNIPGVLHGVKFDETSGTTLVISFDSNRVPVWGDFYAKDGKDKVTKDIVQIWNEGFLTEDPLDPASDGTILNHILVPDSVTCVPEPSTLSILCMALLSLAFANRFFKRMN